MTHPIENMPITRGNFVDALVVERDKLKADLAAAAEVEAAAGAAAAAATPSPPPPAAYLTPSLMDIYTTNLSPIEAASSPGEGTITTTGGADSGDHSHGHGHGLVQEHSSLAYENPLLTGNVRGGGDGGGGGGFGHGHAAQQQLPRSY